jgi:hypothetical protein
MHDLDLDPLRQQVTRNPETVSARLVAQHHALHRPARGGRLRLPQSNRPQQASQIARGKPPARSSGDPGNHRPDLPRLAAQFQRHHQRGIMVKGDRGAGRFELLWHRINPVWSWTTDKILNAAAVLPHSILMGVLDVALGSYNATKGFLAQAKKAEPGQFFSNVDWRRLTQQCETMLRRTPSSFVFVYSKRRGIRIFPANSVVGLTSRDLFELYDRSVSSFFENHIECFIGDPRLNSTDIETLDALADFPVERVLELSARGLT